MEDIGFADKLSHKTRDWNLRIMWELNIHQYLDFSIKFCCGKQDKWSFIE